MIADPSGQVMRAPIVIGGSGGSGTRVLRNALIAAGVFMGTRVNDAGDALDFEPWLDCRINHILAATRRRQRNNESSQTEKSDLSYGSFWPA